MPQDEGKLKGRWQRLIAAGAGVAVVGLLGLLVAVNVSIRSGVSEISETAATRYSGDRVETLMKLVGDGESSLAERNRAVWALGRLRARRALPLLRQHYTGEECDHERFLCQRELRKAIDRCLAAADR